MSASKVWYVLSLQSVLNKHKNWSLEFKSLYIARTVLAQDSQYVSSFNMKLNQPCD